MGSLNSTSRRDQDEAELNASPRQKRQNFSKRVERDSLIVIVIGALLTAYSLYFFFLGGFEFNNSTFSVEYPIGLALIVAGLVLYITCQFDKQIHEHLDEIQSQFGSQKPSA